MTLRQTILALVAVPLLLIQGPASAQQDEDAQWLFVLQGVVTGMTADEMTVAAGAFAVAFTDRPERRTEIIPLADFITRSWAEGASMRVDPPNAALADETGERVSVIEIGNAMMADDSVVLTYTVLERLAPNAGDAIALVIDDCSPDPDDCE